MLEGGCSFTQTSPHAIQFGCSESIRPLWEHVATMPEQMGIRELRDRLTATIRRVRNGETIEITHHHQPVAVLAPVRADRFDRLLAAADVTPPEPLDRPLRRFPPTTGVTASEALKDDRAEH